MIDVCKELLVIAGVCIAVWGFLMIFGFTLWMPLPEVPR